MYKVFINDKPIILSESLIENITFLHVPYEAMVLDEIIHKLKNEILDGVVLICKDLQENWSHFLSHFKRVIAGGGLVQNQKGEFLFIFRGIKWDLPKGRIEEGEHIEETAVREVQEECGLFEVELKEFLLTTYHIFFQGYRKKIKETHWYLMHTDQEDNLVPQLEEGITQVEFKNDQQTREALKNTYANIQLVFDCYQSRN